MTNETVPRLSPGAVDALRYAGQRQLTRWGARRLPPRADQRRSELIDALQALKEIKHHDCDCELRRLPPNP